MQIGEAVIQCAQRLESAGSLEARLEAEVLAMHAADMTRTGLFLHWQEPLDAAPDARLQTLLIRRLRGEPLAYLTGHKEFYGLEFQVNEHVLIPRPETELLVDLARAWLAQRGEQAIAADIGTGSGAIAVSLAAHHPNLTLYATDASTEALAVAQSNAAAHNVNDRIGFLAGDLLEPLPHPVDLLVANLPYLRDDQIPVWCGVGTELAWEPKEALAAGTDGLDHLRRLLEAAPRYLRPDGAILLEIGWDQGPAVMALAKARFPEGGVRLHKDLAGLDRVLGLDLKVAAPSGKETLGQTSPAAAVAVADAPSSP